MPLFGRLRNHKPEGKGKKFNFHGAFSKKEDAKRKEREVHGFIEETTIRGQKRYVVMTSK